jgi:hypothetical protein
MAASTVRRPPGAAIGEPGPDRGVIEPAFWAVWHLADDRTSTGSSGVRYGDGMDQDDSVRCTAVAVVVGDDVQRAAVVAAEHAREAPAVDHNAVQHLAAFGDSGASLPGNAGVPDRPFLVGADAVGSRTRPEVGPNTPVHELPGVRDRPSGQPVRVRLGDDERVLAEDDHPVRKPHVVGDLAAGPIGQHNTHDPRLGLLPRHRAGHVHPCPGSGIHDDLVERLPYRAVRLQLGPCHQSSRRGSDEPTVGEPVDRERQSLHPRHDLALPFAVEDQHLTGHPIAHPEPAVVPPRGLAHLQSRRQRLSHTGSDVRTMQDSSVLRSPGRLSRRRGSAGRQPVGGDRHQPGVRGRTPDRPRVIAGDGRRQSVQSDGETKIIQRWPSGSATWAAKAPHSCCEGS